MLFIRTLCAGLLLAGAVARAQAQQGTTIPDSTTTLANQPKHGYQRAEIMGPDDKLHYAYVLPNLYGYASVLPFYRTAAATQRLHIQPLAISLDKVKWMKVDSLYQEHMVLKGKPQRIVATRVVEGPVELFNHTQVDQMVVPIVPGAPLVTAVAVGAAAGAAMAGGIKERHWYLRRAGELVKVQRTRFVEQLTAYFADDALTVAALQQGQLRYPDMVALVRAYNQRRAAAPAPAVR